jgi:hypothetical protein
MRERRADDRARQDVLDTPSGVSTGDLQLGRIGGDDIRGLSRCQARDLHVSIDGLSDTMTDVQFRMVSIGDQWSQFNCGGIFFTGEDFQGTASCRSCQCHDAGTIRVLPCDDSIYHHNHGSDHKLASPARLGVMLLSSQLLLLGLAHKSCLDNVTAGGPR